MIVRLPQFVEGRNREGFHGSEFQTAGAAANLKRVLEDTDDLLALVAREPGTAADHQVEAPATNEAVELKCAQRGKIYIDQEARPLVLLVLLALVAAIVPVIEVDLGEADPRIIDRQEEGAPVDRRPVLGEIGKLGEFLLEALHHFFLVGGQLAAAEQR